MATDSKVVDALHDAGNLERVLQALGCSLEAEDGRGFREGAIIRCPSPDHPDRHPSCIVRASQGQFFCYSACESILPLDLVVSHGRAADRAAAARWVEDLLGIEREPLTQGKRIDDPSLSVAQYLALKHLSAETASRFGLVDGAVWEDGERRRPGYHLTFASDWFGCVVMPNDPPGVPIPRVTNRPRVRNAFGARWPAQVQSLDPDAPHGRPRLVRTNFSARSVEANALMHPQRIYGLPQFAAPAPSGMLARTILLVEGESDVHALHDFGLPNCLGLPGVGAYRAHVSDILGVILAAEGGDIDRLADWTILTWTEPGDAGQGKAGGTPRQRASLAERVAGAIEEHCRDAGHPAPRCTRLDYTAIALPDGSHPGDPCDLLGALIPLYRGDTAAARIEAGRLITAAAFTAAGQTAAALDPAAPAAALEPAQAVLPEPVAMTLGADPWESMGCDGALPAPDALDVPAVLEYLGSKFLRTREGWSERVFTQKNGEEDRETSTIFDVSAVESIDGEDYVTVRAPRAHLITFDTVRFPRAELADPRRTAARLASIGVGIGQRRGPAAALIVDALADRMLRRHGVTHIPAATGWSGRPGTSAFGGIDAEPINDFGARMFRANERRRELRPDTKAAALEWWDAAARLLDTDTDLAGCPGSAAPLLALGAAAAAPLIGPLADLGVHVSPVVWLAGLGGGGKSITQKLAASIFAPALPDNDGQVAFFANANISQAALSARVDSCRDLPLILDDVTQLPPLPGSTSRGDAARIEAAAALGMLVFNRKPIERATREGGIRATRAFRSTALFSAEVSMSSASSRAVVTAGHRRRIATIEAKPMSDRGLGNVFAEQVNRIAATVGGAPGELLVAHTRTLVEARELRSAFRAARDGVADLVGDADVTRTQVESLAVIVLALQLLADACGATLPDLAAPLRAYLTGGAVRDADLANVDGAVAAVEELLASQSQRFESYRHEDSGLVAPVPTMGYLGKEIRPLHDGTRRVVLLRAAMDLLETRHGVNAATVEAAVESGRAARGHQIRILERRVRGTLWLLPPAGADEPDVDPTLPPGHDPDPHGLAASRPSSPRVPGASAAALAAGALVDVPLGYDVRPADTDPTTLEKMMPHDVLWAETTMMGRMPTLAEFSAAVLRWINRDVGRQIRYTEDDGSTTTMHMSWGSGTYLVGDGPACRENVSILKRIRLEARQELEALQLQYRHAGEHEDASHVHDVADVPAPDDPRWAKIDAIGLEAARAQWAAVQEALYQANRAMGAGDKAAAAAAHDAHIRAYRIHLMCRMRHPEWFVQGRDVA